MRVPLMARPLNITGETFGRLTAITKTNTRTRGGAVRWVFKCSCGETKAMGASPVKSGAVKSCGCLARESKTKHGLYGHPLYNIWRGIKKRCYLESSDNYKYYGGQGVEMLESWISDPENFIKWAIDNGWEHGLHTDRIDPECGYTPSNIRFVTNIQNQHNRRGYYNSSSQYKGVSKAMSGNWGAVFNRKNLGTFKSEGIAALEYNRAAFEANGEYAFLNDIKEY